MTDEDTEVAERANDIKITHPSGAWALYDWASDRVVAYNDGNNERLGLFLGSRSARAILNDLREELSLPETCIAGSIELTPGGFSTHFQERPYGYPFHKSVANGFILEIEGASGRLVRFENHSDVACALSPEISISVRQAASLADKVAGEEGIDSEKAMATDLQFVPLPGTNQNRMRCALAYVRRYEGGEVWIDAETAVVLGRHRSLAVGAYMSA